MVLSNCQRTRKPEIDNFKRKQRITSNVVDKATQISRGGKIRKLVVEKNESVAVVVSDMRCDLTKKQNR